MRQALQLGVQNFRHSFYSNNIAIRKSCNSAALIKLTHFPYYMKRSPSLIIHSIYIGVMTEQNPDRLVIAKFYSPNKMTQPSLTCEVQYSHQLRLGYARVFLFL